MEEHVDVSTTFRRYFVDRHFESFGDFEKTLRQFEKVTSTFYCIRSCRRLPNDKRFIYDNIRYECVRGSKRASVSRGIRKTRPKRICCPAVFYVTNKFGDLKITSYKMLHNHARGARHRDTSLNDFEENEMKPLLEYEYTTGELQQFALVHFNKFLSTHDVMNLKEKTAAERRRECNAKQGANLIKEDTLTLDSPVRSKNDHGYIAADSDDEATSVSLEKRIRGLLSSTDRNTQLHIISLVEARRSMSKDQYGELIRGLTNYTEAFMKAVVPNSCKYVPG